VLSFFHQAYYTRITAKGEKMKKGKAYIIGAGPGDFELLTIKAKRILFYRFKTYLSQRLTVNQVIGWWLKLTGLSSLTKNVGLCFRTLTEISMSIIEACFTIFHIYQSFRRVMLRIL